LLLAKEFKGIELEIEKDQKIKTGNRFFFTMFDFFPCIRGLIFGRGLRLKESVCFWERALRVGLGLTD
jgi:hypothetical protein